MFRIIIEEITPGTPDVAVERFRQTVDALDIPRIVAMINTKPRIRNRRTAAVKPVRMGPVFSEPFAKDGQK